MSLIGCGGATNFPDSVASSAASGPPISGSVFGGHAPIVGAHVYLLQPSTTAYGGVATSLLGNNNTTSDSSGVYKLTANVNDPHVPTAAPAPEYVTSDSTGSFSFTGAYKCMVGQPVYVYAFGGNVGPTSGTPVTFTGDIKISATSATQANNGTFTYTFTFTTTNAPTTPLAVGDTVNLALTNDGVFSGDFGDGWNNLKTVTVATVNSTTNPTSFTGTSANNTFVFGGATGTGTYTFTVAPTNPTAQNNSIVELATLGNCPSSGNFSTAGNGALSFVFLNEVSTVATAYTFQPFTLAANNDAWHIGTTGGTQAQLAIANAANTAAQLYNIQGNGPASTTADGEGHIANATTPNGNGTVPQAEIDTLADIIASCVDSTPGSGGSASSQCSAIFKIATDNGETGGIQPTDTGTAAINIARFPDGNHSAGNGNVDATFAKDLFAIASGTVPFTPELAAVPNDWTLAITYTDGSIAKTNGNSPHAIAVDGSGNVYHADFGTDTFSVLSPLGIPTTITITAPNTLDGPVSIALDSSSSNVWLANLNGTTVSRCPIAGGTCVATSLGGLTNPQDAEIDGSGNVWVSASGTPPARRNGNITNQGIVEISSAATPGVLHTFTNANDVDGPTGLSITSGAAGDIYAADTAGANVISQCTGAAGCTELTGAGTPATDDTAVDGNGDIWITNNDGTVAAIAVTGTNFVEVGNSLFTTGATTASDGVAIDGANNAWVSNSGASTVFVLTTAGVVNSTTGFKSTSGLDPDGIAVDPSGNVWYDTTNGGIVELVGAAAPTVTPLSFAVANSKLGTKPK
jgi:hypothetical protein